MPEINICGITKVTALVSFAFVSGSRYFRATATMQKQQIIWNEFAVGNIAIKSFLLLLIYSWLQRSVPKYM